VSFAFSFGAVAFAAKVSTILPGRPGQRDPLVSTSRNDKGAGNFRAWGETNSVPVAPKRWIISATSSGRLVAKTPKESPAL